MTLEEMTPADCQNVLCDAIADLHLVIDILSKETGYGYMLIGISLRDAKRMIEEAQDDLRREEKRQ